MTRYRALALITKYWMPKTDYLSAITEAAKKVKDGDFLVVSEKAISTARGNILDESRVQPGKTARFLATIWMQVIWGYFLGVLSHFGNRLLARIRSYPQENGSRHKQVVLECSGLLQALMFGSEGGIDGSNLPYSLVSLPLEDSQAEAEAIRQRIKKQLGKKVTVVIVDTDKTYGFRNFYFTPRPKPMKGIISGGGIITYLIGRTLKFKRRPTPLALAGANLSVEAALAIANVADKARGPGSGATVWDMAARFKVSATGVSWDMLTRLEHKPIVIV
ncbi:MAG TPA: coenzyme F420-0:L-glutamate ligase, partial [Candidatus Nanoarchaeia archaeon]|nr:coenzyme F420-0:L-glutamate ligase [Candidatus Nanoarchaeia archaeon]